MLHTDTAFTLYHFQNEAFLAHKLLVCQFWCLLAKTKYFYENLYYLQGMYTNYVTKVCLISVNTRDYATSGSKKKIWFATSDVVVRTYITELILLYIILRSIINIIDRLFLNSIQKSQWAHRSISPRVELRDFQTLPSFEIL